MGTGLHTGARVSVTLHPAEVDSGIRFKRYDRPGAPALPARFDQVCDTTMCTTLGEPGGVMVATVEHLMASLAICEIDNVLVEVSGPELPIMDGSAEPFVFLIECAGVVRRPSAAPDRGAEAGHRHRPRQVRRPRTRRRLRGRLRDPVRPSGDRQPVAARPLLRRRLQDRHRARRTFGFAERIEELWSRGLALGGSLKNTIVVSQDRVLNEEGLRFPDEFVRHKVLDSIGDLYLAGGQLIGRYTGRCAGHTMHNKLLRALFADPTAWRMVDATDPDVFDPPARRVAGA